LISTFQFIGRSSDIFISNEERASPCLDFGGWGFSPYAPDAVFKILNLEEAKERGTVGKTEEDFRRKVEKSHREGGGLC